MLENHAGKFTCSSNARIVELDCGWDFMNGTKVTYNHNKYFQSLTLLRIRFH